MFNYLIGAWIITSMFGSSYNQRRKRYNKLVAKHLKQMDERIIKYIGLIRRGSIAERGIADALSDNLDIYSLEDINYLLNGIAQELPEAATRIAQYIDAMPGTPQARGYGVEFV